MGKKKSLGVNYLFNLSYQLLTIVLPIITTPYISRVLSADGVGISNYTYAVVHICTILAALGTNKYAMREVAYHQNDREKNTKLFSEIIVLRLICVLLILVGYSVIVIGSPKYRIIYLIMSMDILAVLLDISWFFQGLEEFKITVVRNFIIKLSSVVLMFLFVKNSDDVWKYALIMAAATFLGQLTMWPYLRRYINKLSFRNLNVLQHLKPSLVFFIPTIAIQVYTNLDKILIGMISTEAQVGYYSQAEKIVKLVLTIISSFGTVLMPRMAVLLKSKDWDNANENIKKSLNFVCILSFPMCVGLIIISSRFIPWFLGAGYNQCIMLLRVLSPLIIIMGIASTIGAAILIPLGRQKWYNVAIISGMVVNLLLNLCFIPNFQSVGASIATVFAESTVTVLELYFLRDIIHIKDVIKQNWHYAVCAVLMALPSILLNSIVPMNLVGMIILILVSCTVYLAALVVTKDKFLFTMIETIRKKIHK